MAQEPRSFEEEAGSGPEYHYPTTDPKEPIPVVNVDQVEGEGGPDVVGEDEPELTDDQISKEEQLEEEELEESGPQWSEALAKGPGAPSVPPAEPRG